MLSCRCGVDNWGVMAHTSVAAAHLAEGDFRVGSIFRRTASVLSRRFLAFFIVSLIANSPTLLLARMLTVEPTDLDQSLSVLGSAVLGLVGLIVLSTLGEAVIMHAAFQDVRRRPVRLAESLNVGLRRFLPIVGFAFVAFFLIWLGLILLIIPGLILYTMWFVGLPACVIERLGPWTSLRRSRELTKGHRWKLFGLALLLIVTSLGGSLIQFGLIGVASPVFGLVGRLIWKGIWGAVATVVIAVTYHDLRIAKEGGDIEQIGVVFD
jgi:hypothetical protein